MRDALVSSVHVVTALLTALLLTGTPEAPGKTPARLTWRLSVGSFLGSVWAAPSFRANVEALKNEQLGGPMGQQSLFDSQYLVYATPVIGPWLTLIRGGQQARDDMWLLITSGLLQGVGLSALTWRTLNWNEGSPSDGRRASSGLVLDISPYVAGRLGVSLTLSGW